MSERQYRKERRDAIREQLEKRHKEEERREAFDMARHYSQLSNADGMLQSTNDFNIEGEDVPLNMERNERPELLERNRKMKEIGNLEENTSVFEDNRGDNILNADMRWRRNTYATEHKKLDEIKIERECVSMPDISQEIKELDMRLEILKNDNIEAWEKYVFSSKTDLEFPTNANAAKNEGDVGAHRKFYNESERKTYSSSRHGSGDENRKGKELGAYPKEYVATNKTISSGANESLRKQYSDVGTRPKYEVLSPIYADEEVDNQLKVRLETEKERSLQKLQEHTRKRENNEKDKEERFNIEMEHEKYLVNKLEEQNRKLDIERKIREEEERLVMERIDRLKKAEEELNRQRMERKELEKAVHKKMELEDLRRKRLSLLHNQEEELVRSLSNLTVTQREEARERKKERDMFDQYGFVEGREATLEGYDPNERDSLNMKAEKYSYGKPRIPRFDGSDFKVWKIEVECILRSKMYPESLIAQAMRNSLQGQTRKVLLTIDPLASSEQILEKLEDIYGTTQTEDSIMQDFFNAKQEDNETTSEWALRLETIMQLAVEFGEILDSRKNALLKQRFWKGLASEKLRNNTRVTFESSATFEVLRKKTRMEEEEMKRGGEKSSKVTSPAMREMQTPMNAPKSVDPIAILQQTRFKETQDEEQLKMMKAILDKMKSLEKDLNEMKRENKRMFEMQNNSGQSEGNENQNSSQRVGFHGRGRSYNRNNYDKQSHKYQPNEGQNSYNEDKKRISTDDKKDERQEKENKPLNR